MADADAKLIIGADTQQLEDAVKRAESAVAGGFESMRKNTQGLQGELQKLTGGFGDFAATITKSFGSITAGFGAMAAVVGGGAILSRFVDQTKEVTGAAVGMGKAMGISATQASILNEALQSVGIQNDVFLTATQKLNKQLVANEGGLNDYGIATRDAAGHLLEQDQIVLNAVESLNKMEAGTARNIRMQEIFGAKGTEAAQILKLTRQSYIDAADRAERFGTVIGQEDVEAYSASKRAGLDMVEGLKGIGLAIGSAVLPVLTDLANMLAEVLPVAIQAMKYAMAGLMTPIDLVSAAIKTLWLEMKRFGDDVAQTAIQLASAFDKLMHHDWSGAKADLAILPKIWHDTAVETANEVDKVGKELEQRLHALWGPKTAAPKQKAGDRTDDLDSEDTGKTKEPKSNVPRWEQQLRDWELIQQEKAQAEGKFYQASTQLEIDFWKTALVQTKAGTEENLQVRAKITELEKKLIQDRYQAEVAALRDGEAAARNNLQAKLAFAEQELIIAKQKYGEESKQALEAAGRVAEIQRSQVAQDREIADLKAAAARDGQLAEIDAQERASKTAYALKQVNLQQLLALEESYEDRRYAIRQKAAQDSLKLVDPRMDPVAYQKALNEIEKIRIQHDAKMQELTLQGVKADDGIWAGMWKGIADGFDSTFKKFAQGTLTMKQLFADLATSVLNVMTNAFAKIAEEWIVDQARQLIVGKTTALANAQSAAGLAGANAVASTALAPWPINMTAPAVGAEMFAAAQAFGAAASASGGFDIPAGVNPLTQLHAKEMVLPAHIADPLRETLAGGSTGGDQHIHIHAVDAMSFKRMLESNSGALQALIRGQMRNFAT